MTVTIGGTSGDRSDGQPQQSDIHNAELGHGADGDGEGGCGRRCGRRRCNAEAHGVGGGYGSVSKDLEVTINDDDTAGITVSESALTIKEGGSDTYTVVLDTQPTAS